MTYGIKTSNLRLDYGNTRALDGMTFSIEGGKIVGLLGRNGSGKTSLVSVLAAFRKPTDGTVEIDGQQPFENPEITSGICLIREGGDVNDTWRVKDNLEFAARYRANWDWDLAGKLLDRFELSRRDRVKALSRGAKSALGVVLGLASRCPLTIFDEVHLGMDAPSRYAFYEELLNDYLAKPRTFVLSTHLIEEVASLLEDVLIIDAGRVVLHEPAEDIRERGVSITGPAEAVEQFGQDLTVLNRQQLGASAQITTFGSLSQQRLRDAKAVGLELGPVPLQDLFVHLTNSAREPK